MPEGPQVKRIGMMLDEFRGAQITEITSYTVKPKEFGLVLPIVIDHVEVKGKNIFMYLQTTQVLYSHMLMWGKWALGCEPTLGNKRLNTCFTTTQGEIGFYGGGVLKTVTAEEAEKIKQRLGPDIIAASTEQEAFARLRDSSLQIGEALLDQELISGIGNIYKSEALFIAQVNPLAITKELAKRSFSKFYEFLHAQMVKDVTDPGIITVTPELRTQGYRRYVYKRWHQPCLVCGTKIERMYQGKMERSTYYCPRCQNVSS